MKKVNTELASWEIEVKLLGSNVKLQSHICQVHIEGAELSKPS